MKRKSTRAEVAEARVAELEAERDASTPHRNRDYSTNPITDERLAQMCDETRWWKSDGDEIYRAVHELRDLRAKAAAIAKLEAEALVPIEPFMIAADRYLDGFFGLAMEHGLPAVATAEHVKHTRNCFLGLEREYRKQATTIARLTKALRPAIAELVRLREVHLPRFEGCIGEPDKEIMDRGMAALSPAGAAMSEPAMPSRATQIAQLNAAKKQGHRDSAVHHVNELLAFLRAAVAGEKQA